MTFTAEITVGNLITISFFGIIFWFMYNVRKSDIKYFEEILRSQKILLDSVVAVLHNQSERIKKLEEP
jgi:hypothetical protein